MCLRKQQTVVFRRGVWACLFRKVTFELRLNPSDGVKCVDAEGRVKSHSES